MSMYGYDVSIYDYGFSDPAISGSIYGNSISPMAAAIDYDDELYVRRRPPTRQRPPMKTPSSPPKHRHDGTSPLPLGMDWSLAPLVWEGRNSVWPHDLHKGWSYCVTIPSLSSEPSPGSSDTVFYSVKVGIQSPEGITTSRTVPRRFNEFLKLYSELKQEFPKKNLPQTPSKGIMKTKTKKVLEDRMRALESWMTKLLSDIDVSRTAPVAMFLELEAAARQACCELYENESADMDNSLAYETSDASASSPEKENHDQHNIHNVTDRGLKSEENGEGLHGDFNLSVTTKMEMEDLVTRLNQETIARKYFETKVKDLEMELETRSQSSKDMQCDIEELQRKCMELDLRLTIEQEARTYAESVKETTIKQNELLIKELGDMKEQVEILKKQKEEMKLKSKSEDKVMIDTCVSLSDTIDVLETADSQIGLLLAQGENGESGSGVANEDDELRKLLGDILVENSKLRKQVNSVIRHAQSKTDME